METAAGRRRGVCLPEPPLLLMPHECVVTSRLHGEKAAIIEPASPGPASVSAAASLATRGHGEHEEGDVCTPR